MTPEQLVAHFTNEDAAIQEEVARIFKQLKERQPGAGHPKHFNFGQFSLPLPKNADKAFMEKVAQHLQDKYGWEAEVKVDYDNEGDLLNLVLKSPALDKLPKVERTIYR